MKPVILVFRCIGGLNPHLTPEKIGHLIGKAVLLKFSDTCFLCESTNQANLALEKAAAVLDAGDEYFVFPVGPEVISACAAGPSETLKKIGLALYRVPSTIGRKQDEPHSTSGRSTH